MKFNWKRFKVENIAVECCNKEEMVDFLDLLKNNDINEHGLKEYLLENGRLFEYPIYFASYPASFDYYYVAWNRGTYYKDADYTILKWKDYMNCNSANNKELFTKEQLENKIYSIEEELKVAKQQLEELKAKKQFKEDIKCFNIKLSDEDKEKAELREKIYKELTLFAKLKNDECDLEYLKSDNLIHSIYFDYKCNKIYQISLINASREWIPFKSEEVCRTAIELFRDDLEEYYNM